MRARKVKVFVRCLIDGCAEDAHCAGRCTKHYMKRWSDENRTHVQAYARDYARSRRQDPAYLERDRARTRLHARKQAGIKDATDEKGSGPCEICGREGLRLCCDHDHDTGLTRGWLCVACNRGLGYMQDSPRLLATALLYLGKSGKVWK